MQHLLKVRNRFLNIIFEGLNTSQHHFQFLVLHLHTLNFLVLVEGEVVVVIADFLYRNEEGLVLAGAAFLGIQILEAGDNVGNVVLGNGIAFVVQTESVGLHFVEPHLVGTAAVGLGENENGGAHTGIWFEHTARHRDYGLQALVSDQFLADGLVCLAVAEEYAVGHNACTAPAHFEHAHEQGEKQQFGLGGARNVQQRLAHHFLVKAAGERRIGKYEGVVPAVRVVGGKAVLPLDIGIIDAVQHHVHGTYAEHRAVGVEAGEHFVLVSFENIRLHKFLGVMAGNLLGALHNEAGAAHSGVADSVLNGGLHKGDHH